jgi:lysophospholipase L1-like esterase
LFSNLAGASHTVELVRRTETFSQYNEFLGFQLEQGKKLLPLSRSQRRIEFIGNSITCGYGIEAGGTTEDPTPENQNVTLAFSGVTARNFSADQLIFCRSGIGMYRSGNTEGPSADAMINVYDRLNMYDQDKKWDYTSFVPQVVVIDLGTNDFNGAGADSTLFTQAYETFVTRVRSNYPIAKIFAVVGPMMGGDELIRIKSYLTSMVDRLNKAGDSNVYFFELTGQGCCGVGSYYHPSVGQAKMNARELTEFIESKTDWKARPAVDSIAISPDGKLLELQFTKNMTGPSSNSNSFSVTSTSGKTINVKSAVISNANPKKVILSLDTPISYEDTLTYIEGSFKSQEGELLGTFVESLENSGVTNLVSDQQGSQFSIFHQPGNSSLIIQTEKVTTDAEINLYNLQGMKISTLYKGQLSVGKSELVLNSKQIGLPEGLYIIKAELDGKLVAKKLYIKE